MATFVIVDTSGWLLDAFLVTFSGFSLWVAGRELMRTRLPDGIPFWARI